MANKTNNVYRVRSVELRSGHKQFSIGMPRVLGEAIPDRFFAFEIDDKGIRLLPVEVPTDEETTQQLETATWV